MFSEYFLCAPYINNRYMAHSICAALPYSNQNSLLLQMFATFPSPEAKPQVWVVCTSQCYMVYMSTPVCTHSHIHTHIHMHGVMGGGALHSSRM